MHFFATLPESYKNHWSLPSPIAIHMALNDGETKACKKRTQEDAHINNETGVAKKKTRMPYTVHPLNEDEVEHRIDVERQFADRDYSQKKQRERQKADRENEVFQRTYEETMTRWQSLTTYQEMLQENVDYLRGKREQSFCYAGPIDDETYPLVPNLIRLHERGFLSTGSQPAVDELVHYKNTRLNYKSWLHLQQRAFVEFFCSHEERYIQLVQKFLADAKTYKVHMTRIFYDDTIANFDYFRLTRSKVGNTYDECKKSRWECNTSSRATSHGTEYDGQNAVFCKNQDATGGYMHVFIAKMKWGPPKDAAQDLLQDILDACREFRIPTTYDVG